MRNLSLWCLVVPWLVVETATDESQDMGQKFQAFQELTQKWFLPDEPPKARKKHLAAAFKVAKPLLKWMSTLDTFPPGLDPLTFAAKVISLRQKWQHAKMAVPLIINALGKMKNTQNISLREECRADVAKRRRSCQDAFAILCHTLHSNEVDGGESGKFVGLSAEQCVEEYNQQRPAERHFATPDQCNRQLPSLTAKGWWSSEEVPYPILEHVRSSIELIQEEVLRVTGAAEFADWDPLKNDPTLTTNTDWDPRASWDAIPLFFQNKWTDACVSFPLTCSVLQQGGELEMLCDTRRYADLVPPAILEQDYDEVPTLGVKLYRVWPGAGLKSHTGSPARIVNSVALHAPPNSSITVAGERRPWATGVMHHFDDSFFHSVDNPHSSEFRIVLAIMTWHPDLMVGTGSLKHEL